MAKGARKGFGYERTVCKELSFWWTNDERDDVFWRTSGSGSRATSRMKKGKSTANSYGDIMAIDPIGQPLIDACFIEVKRGYTRELDVLNLLDLEKGKSILEDWWEKAEEKRSKTEQKNTLIIFKRDRHTACILMFEDLFIAMEDYDMLCFGGNISISRYEKEALTVIRLKDFLNLNPSFFEVPTL